MKHVHAETIIELAKDLTGLVQHRVKGMGAIRWEAFPDGASQMELLVQLGGDFETRIKPQPKAISWTNMYKSGQAGRSYTNAAAAAQESGPRVDLIAIVEVRDDGTAHLHKVEA